jgi:hypothetical protein
VAGGRDDGHTSWRWRAAVGSAPSEARSTVSRAFAEGITDTRSVGYEKLTVEINTSEGEINTFEVEVFRFEAEVFTSKVEVFRFEAEVFTSKVEVFRFKAEVFTLRSKVFTSEVEVFRFEVEVFTSEIEVSTSEVEGIYLGARRVYLGNGPSHLRGRCPPTRSRVRSPTSCTHFLFHWSASPIERLLPPRFLRGEGPTSCGRPPCTKLHAGPAGPTLAVSKTRRGRNLN